MSYYTGQGDYYSGKGDPGLFSAIGKGLGLVGSILPGPLGGAAKFAGGLLGGTKATPSTPRSYGPSMPAVPTPGVMGMAQRAIPGGKSGYQCNTGNSCGSGYHLNKAYSYAHSAEPGTMCVRNRKLNPTNPAALARASKRIDKFVNVAKGALKHTNYKVVNKSYKQNWRKPLKRG